jgi:iron complex transport system ATP-binding protein
VIRGSGIGWASILADVALDAPPGGLVGLLGPNGSGKSSLLRVLAGLQKPDRGTVTVDGVDRSAIPRRALARRLAVVTQHAPVEADLTVTDVLLLGRIPHRPLLAPVSADDLARTEAALAGAGLTGFGPRRWTTLSGGERQRVDIARALLQEPDILLLDEPTNHLDIRHQLDLLAALRAMPATVVTALHDLDLAARHCDHLVLLAAGRVVAAGPPPVVLTPALIEEVFEVTAEVTTDPDGRWQVRTRLSAASSEDG